MRSAPPRATAWRRSTSARTIADAFEAGCAGRGVEPPARRWRTRPSTPPAAGEDDEAEEDAEAAQGEIEVGRRDDTEEIAPGPQVPPMRKYKDPRSCEGPADPAGAGRQGRARQSRAAALTTYLSLAGRYCVLMPNTARGGGILPQDYQCR